MGTSSSAISKYFRMLSFASFLRESLNAPAPWKWGPNPDRWIANFKIGELEYEIEISPEGSVGTASREDDYGGAWEVAFSLKYPDPYYPKNTSYPTPRLTAFHVTGTGKAYTVFATIVDILEHFVESVTPDSLFFHAEEMSRRKLYTRLVKMAPTIDPNYTYEIGRVGDFWIKRLEE